MNRDTSYYVGQVRTIAADQEKPVSSVFKTLPSTLKRFGNEVDARNPNIPFVSDVYGFTASASKGAGHLLGGNVGKAYPELKKAYGYGKNIAELV